MSGATPPGAVRTTWLLLNAARRRAAGRRRRARQIFRHRTGGRLTDWRVLGLLLSIAVMVVVNGAAATLVDGLVTAGQRIEAERDGALVVEDGFLRRVRRAQDQAVDTRHPAREADAAVSASYPAEAARLAERYGGSAGTMAARLRTAVLEDRLVARSQVEGGLTALGLYRGFPALFGSLALLWWAAMLVMQGEGPELDTQRRRHPMWEWLLSHPIRTGPMFAAEMLAPVAANPLFWSAPLVPGVLYGLVYGPALGVLAGFAAGIPLAVALACLGKALEIGVLLRVGLRARGGVMGLMGWLGSTMLAVVVVGWYVSQPVASVLAPLLRPLTALPWPWLGLMLGEAADGSFSFATGLVACWAASAVAVAGSVGFSVWSAQHGLAAPAGSRALAPSRLLARPPRFGRDPLYRKELLWFARDRSAIVQAILVPVSMAGLQLFSLRGMLVEAEGSWNSLCGAAILFGTYFLAVLGPRSLASEGSALWIALTWPRGLESLLRAKARLWTLLASGLVGAVLAYAAWQFPAESGAIALVGGGWVLFARSMALKAVTLATVPGPSGQAEKIPLARRWAVCLGALTFAVGVLTRQWPAAITGIVYSTMTAAAMWQDFRARLPYLHDPWSARMPPPPTLMHAMIAISLLVELGAVAGGAAQALAGPGGVAIARALGYGATAACVSVGVAAFLRNRGVPASAIWWWAPRPGWWGLAAELAGAGLLGAGLGLLALGYLAILHQVEWARPLLDAADQQMASLPHLRQSSFVMAVLIAPVAEEYLFRGLLYRALEREWPGWRAIAGSAAFFAIYHPALSWLPVASLGALNAVVFRRTGRLATAVVLHMGYNAVVLS